MSNRSPLSFVQGVAMSVGWQDSASSLPELIFKVVREALAASNVAMDQIDSVILAAHDVVDGRSLSSMVTAPAAGAYLRDEIRLAEDGLAAVSVASARIEAGETEFAIVAAWGRASEGDYTHTSRFAFDPFLAQPFALDEFSLSSLRLSGWLAEHGEHDDARRLAGEARIRRAQQNSRAARAANHHGRPKMNFPLLASEAPRLADIAVAAILGKRPAPVRIVGVGHSAECATLGDRRLTSMQSLREAVERAGAGDAAADQRLDVVQLAGPTLPDEALALEALGLAAPGQAFDAYAAMDWINPSGGSESGWCFPTTGLTNFAEAYFQLTQQAGGVQLGGRCKRALATGNSPLGGQVSHALVLEAE
jgi:acetyl-CoA C-acetyltransferase